MVYCACWPYCTGIVMGEVGMAGRGTRSVIDILLSFIPLLVSFSEWRQRGESSVVASAFSCLTLCFAAPERRPEFARIIFRRAGGLGGTTPRQGGSGGRRETCVPPPPRPRCQGALPPLRPARALVFCVHQPLTHYNNEARSVTGQLLSPVMRIPIQNSSIQREIKSDDCIGCSKLLE